MKTTVKKFDAKAAKKAISDRTKDFEKGLLESKNSFQLVVVYQKMLAVLTSEVDSWCVTIQEYDGDESTEAYDYRQEAETHVAGLMSLIDTIKAQRAAIIDDALIVQQAMINSHKLTGPVIFK